MLVNKAFSDLITFTRASPAWRFNASGILVQDAANTPRVDCDPLALQPRGLLLEEGRTNLITYSAGLENAAWSKSNCTVTPAAGVAPDGTTSACKVIGASGASARYLASAAATASNALVVGSIFAKAGEHSKFRLNLTNFASDSRGVYVDLATGAIYQTDTSGSDFTGISGSMTSVGGGWYRCVVLALKGAANSVVRLAIDPKDNSGAASGDGTSGIYAWGGQLELGAFPTSYVPTTSAAVARAADAASITDLTKIGLNPVQGTLYAEFVAPNMTVAANQSIFSLSDGTTANRIQPFINAGVLTTRVTTAGVAADFTSAISGASAVHKLAIGCAAGSAALSVDGGAAAQTSPTAFPAVSRLYLGSTFDGLGFFLNGYLRALRYYPRKLSNAELQALTAA